MMNADAPSKKYSSAETISYAMVACGIGLAVGATLHAFLHGDSIAMVLASFGWITLGIYSIKDIEQEAE